MYSKVVKVNTNSSSINLILKIQVNTQYRMMMKYEMKETWNWKQVEITLWKEQRDKGMKEISEERRKKIEQSDNDMTYKEMI